MSTLTVEELRQSVVNLRTTLAFLMTEVHRNEARVLMLRATLSQHQHDWTRDITGKPTGFTPAAHFHSSYATPTHVHNYQDSRLGDLDNDIARTTDAAREP